MDWQPIETHGGRYEVSRDGRVRKSGGGEIGQWANDTGYKIVRLSRPRAMCRVHRLVAEAFIANPCDKPFINHLDGNPANNSASNLEWCTQKENLKHAEDAGRLDRSHWTGKRSPNARLDDATVAEIRETYLNGSASYSVLAERYNVSKRAIGRLINGETYG